jgi:hypothetical protein
MAENRKMENETIFMSGFQKLRATSTGKKETELSPRSEFSVSIFHFPFSIYDDSPAD